MHPSITRRDFARLSALAVGTLAVGAGCGGGTEEGAGAATDTADASPRPLDILVLGGTGFIGPHQVQYALDRGHSVTLFNRGQSAPDRFPDLETIIGDRENDLEGLRGRQWDAVIDNSATNPEWVRASAQLLADSAGRYLYVSSTGVFFPYLTTGADESVEPLLEKDPEKGMSSSYGVDKALSEDEVEDAFGDRAVVVRPHFIAGPGDPTDRFTSWPVRLADRSEVVGPGTPEDPVQYIDVRDLTSWMVRLLENEVGGVFNAGGPAERQGVGEFIRRVAAGIGSTAEVTWIDDLDFLGEHQFSAVPWIPPEGDLLGMATVNSDKALSQGLVLRPVEETARDSLEWFRSQPEERQAELRHGPDAEAEAQMLAAWKARTNA
ncbi:MAG: NAD-dependent epimerase/dehydratase family protein [Gemmatimonadetes bacterium]|nr:NAD-dependent epimerase/dehydratase family protein [Gemmatimonadota bacterium]